MNITIFANELTEAPEINPIPPHGWGLFFLILLFFGKLNLSSNQNSLKFVYHSLKNLPYYKSNVFNFVQKLTENDTLFYYFFRKSAYF